jgi:DNA-binding Lrp family transcriptional regulator
LRFLLIYINDLASKLGLSVNAVHERIQAMRESGIIRNFTVRISLSRKHSTSNLLVVKGERKVPTTSRRWLIMGESISG